ncbi:MAG: hypothetical protein ACE5Q6_06465 [Dehalococcoidia bacterium]
MVQNPRATPGPGSIRPLNLPVPVTVRENRRQRPISVTTEGRALPVTAITDLWEIDDEWWRDRPIARLYYRVTVRGGRQLTLYRDLLDGTWYRQNF